MGRVKSEDKRNAILAAATEVFAERGLGAPTTAITKAAAVAEGTLFIYFATKDELIDAVYRDIKVEMADAMMAGYPRKASVRNRLEYVWTKYVEWGVANPSQHRVLKQIEVWNGLTEESRRAGSAAFIEIQEMSDEAAANKIIVDSPQQFVAAMMSSMADATMTFMRSDPKRADVYRSSGFEILWAGITRKK